MNRVGIVHHPVYLEHDTGSHPENAGRLVETSAYLEKTGATKQLVTVQPRPATVEEIAAIHDPGYIRSVAELCARGGGWLDLDTVASPKSYDAALYAAGGLMEATAAVLKGELDSAFALVRPPGHHAVRNRAMGFCLFNNIAIAARYAQASFGLSRILIVDFDVHHGNGTQDAFYDDSSVLYFSTHQYPLYPGTGTTEETGTGKGKGYNINVPLPVASGDEVYMQALREILIPIARRFQPQLIMVSAGYDLHWADHLATMQVSVSGVGQMVSLLKELAQELCQGRSVYTLEGGYNYKALAASIRATFDVLLGNPVDDPLGPPPPSRSRPRDVSSLLQSIKRIHNLP